METEEVVRLLSHYRHDIMNHLQIIQGYLGMNKTDRVQAKLSDYIGQLNQERRLMSLGMPDFALWVIRFNSVFDHFRLTYDISTDQHPSLPNETDQQLTETCRMLFEMLRANSQDNALHNVHLQVNETKKSSAAYVIQITIKGSFSEMAQLANEMRQMMHSVNVLREKDYLVCVITIKSNE